MKINKLLIGFFIPLCCYGKGYDYSYSISSIDETLMTFPSAIISSSCQPAEYLNIVQVDASMDNYIKIVPSLKETDQTRCSFKLEDNSVYNINFDLKKMTILPYIDLSIDIVNLSHRTEDEKTRIFLELLSENKEQNFNKLNLPENKNVFTDEQNYSLVFHGKQGNYYGVILKIKKNMRGHLILKNTKIGSVYYTSLKGEFYYILSKSDFQWEEIRKSLP